MIPLEVYLLTSRFTLIDQVVVSLGDHRLRSVHIVVLDVETHEVKVGSGGELDVTEAEVVLAQFGQVVSERRPGEIQTFKKRAILTSLVYSRCKCLKKFLKLSSSLSIRSVFVFM